MHTLRAMSVPVLHLVSRLWVGGSERQFIERLRAHPPGYTPVAACLELSGGNLAEFLSLGLPAPDPDRKETILGKPFDPAKPEDYLASFAIRRG